MEKKFVSIERKKGFHMTFENGLTVSVVWGAGTYSDNQYSGCSDDTQSDTAEVAVARIGERKLLDANRFVTDEDAKSCENVLGFLTPEQVVDLLVNVRSYTADEIAQI